VVAVLWLRCCVRVKCVRVCALKCVKCVRVQLCACLLTLRCSRRRHLRLSPPDARRQVAQVQRVRQGHREPHVTRRPCCVMRSLGSVGLSALRPQ